MMWLRSHLPLESDRLGMWESLNQTVPKELGTTLEAPSGLWARLGEAPFDGDSVANVSKPPSGTEADPTAD